MDRMPLAAVVVNLDGGAMLDACLDALAADAPAATVVVDNGSSPAELGRLEARRGVTVVRLPENRGFAAPANAGLSAALAAGALPFVAFVNNDCVLEPGYLRRCLAALEADAGLAAAQGVVLNGAGGRVDGCGIVWNGRGEALQLLRGETPPPLDAAPFGIPGVSATAAVFRTEAFRGAGGFEESFFAYYEDVDLSLRLSRAGARFVCVPSARARHLGSATGQRSPEARWRRLFANRIRTLRRNLAPSARGSRAIPPSALRGAAAELGWTKALAAASAALLATETERRRDREVLHALPPLTKLPT